jgi:glycosyltransferase involved in cell wall biosynthesis
VCYADGIWELAAAQTLLGRRPWPRDLTVEGWIYRTRFGDPTDRRLRSQIRRWLFTRLLHLGAFKKLHLDGELLFDYVERFIGRTPTEVVLTPNPVVVEPLIAKAQARRALGLSTDGAWLSLSGMIARFKGADLLLEAFKLLSNSPDGEGIRLLLAGPHEEQIRDLLHTPPFPKLVGDGRIVSLDRFVDEHEMYLAAAAADLVLAPYPRHQGRSSIILWAAAAGRPSLGADDGVIGYVIRHQQLGSTCNVRDIKELAVTIVTALDAPWTDSDIARVREYAMTHRIEIYQEVASKLVRSQLAERAKSPASASP